MTDDVLRDALRRAAEDYADLAEVETLIGAALARRDWRARRSHARACVVCQAPLIGARSDAETCSEKCRQKKARTSRLRDV